MNILSKKRQSIFGNKKIMVKSGRFHVHQWCLIFFLTMKVKMRREAPSSKCPRQCDTAECFFLTSFFFREVTAVWLLPLDPAAIRSLTAKSGPSPITVWYQWILWLSIHSVLVLLGSIAKPDSRGMSFPSPGIYMAAPQPSYLSTYLLLNILWPTFHREQIWPNRTWLSLTI